MLFGAKYPNPDAVVYPTVQPPRYAPELTSKDPSKLYPIHEHTAFVDRKGDGTTDVAAGHYHRIRGGRILPDCSDGHTHRLTGLPAGAG